MSQFRQVSKAVDELESIWNELSTTSSSSASPIPPPTQSAQTSTGPKKAYNLLLTLPSKLTEITPALESFSGNLTKFDPVTNEPRYGPKMQEKVSGLLSRVDKIRGALDGGDYDSVKEKLRVAAGVEEDAERVRRENEEREREKAAREERERILAEEAEERERERAERELIENERLRDLAAANAVREEEERLRRDEIARFRNLESGVGHGRAATRRQIDSIRSSCANETERRKVIKALTAIFEQIVQRPEEILFRRIRLGNEGFHNAIGKFDGGIEVIVSGGFKFRFMTIEEVEDKYLVLDEPNLEGGEMEEWGAWFESLKVTLEVLKGEA